MTTLRVVLDQMLAPVPGGIGRYTLELTKELIANAPTDCHVTGIVSSHPAKTYRALDEKLPGLSSLKALSFKRPFLSRAWQRGLFTSVGNGLIHAPSLFAPLREHESVLTGGQQLVVTVHDTVPWSHPETLTRHGVAWHTAMAKRAFRYADGVVVPTHAVAHRLSEFFDFGERIRVIGGAPSPTLQLPSDAPERAERLKLPRDYIVAVGTLEPRKGLPALIKALSRHTTSDIPLLIVGPEGWGDVNVSQLVSENGVAPGRVRTLGFLSDRDLAVVLERATALVFPSLAEGFGLPILEAFSLGTPVIHSDDSALVEVAGGAGFVVDRWPVGGYAERLSLAIATVVGDSALRETLSARGRDRARAYSWRASAEAVWQLHADL